MAQHQRWMLWTGKSLWAVPIAMQTWPLGGEQQLQTIDGITKGLGAAAAAEGHGL